MITQLMDDGNTAGVVYLGFTNAFDSVNHRFFLANPESFGLCKKFVLTDGTNLQGAKMSGIPQGSVIGPLIFLQF